MNYYDNETLNKIASLKKRNTIVHKEIYQLQYGITQYCNMKCSFCGAPHKKNTNMTMQTFKNSLKSITNNLKLVIIALHGEPTLNENLPYMIEYLRKAHKQVQINMATNGITIRQRGISYILDLFNKGLNSLIFDCYNKNMFDYFKTIVSEFEKRNINVKNFYQNKLHPYSFVSNKLKRVLFIKDFNEVNSGNHLLRKIHNWCGNLSLDYWKEDVNKLPFKITCAEPFKYLSIFYNGDVGICCRDGTSSIVIGNVNEQTPMKIWTGDNLRIIRYLLKLRRRDLILPCSLCNFKTFRDGLFPFFQSIPSITEIKNVLNNIKRNPTQETLNNLEKIKELKYEKT